jgi:arabinan endo-1,5-alpha-L-arabinosidase
MGLPLLLGVGFEFIDPMAFDDPATGKHWLYWGSGFQPIKVQELAADRMSFAPDSAPVDLVWPNPVAGAFPRLVEAAWVIHHEDHYYLFYSGDNCCGPDAEYGVMVARSLEPDGPFETLEQARGVPHSLMLYKSERWLAPGHNCIVEDKAGEVWIIYHAIDVNRPRQRQEDEINSRRILLIDRIKWSDGWPFVGTPSEEPQAAPVV